MPIQIFQLRMWRDNAVFFSAVFLFIVGTGALLTVAEKGGLVLYFSDHRSLWGDLFFRYATHLGHGLLFLPVLVLLLFVRYRFAVVLPFLGLSVTLVAQSAKALFNHPRPLPYFRGLGMAEDLIPVEGVPLLNGHNSFPSGHTMTAFALFTFLALCLPRKTWGGPLFFLLALAAGISRIYLGQHFLEDVYLGAILGMVLAVSGYLLALRLPAQRWQWLDRQWTGETGQSLSI